jgi:hypothetical protein
MTGRDAQLKAYREYKEALHEAEKKKPEGSWYKVPADDGSEEAILTYNPEKDFIELNCREGPVRIQGKFLKTLLAALTELLGVK